MKSKVKSEFLNDHPYVRAWCDFVGYQPSLILRQVDRARELSAPGDVLEECGLGSGSASPIELRLLTRSAVERVPCAPDKRGAASRPDNPPRHWATQTAKMHFRIDDRQLTKRRIRLGTMGKRR